MGLRDRFVAPQRELSVPERRLKNIATPDLTQWVDNVISQIGKSVRDYQRDGDPANLGEARIGSDSLQAMIAELERRAE
ncbi:MAG: hypothetical protein ABR616_18055 [Dermatophilaceae bacterium]